MFDAQEELLAAFKAGELERDFVAVVRWQGPRANGMPELHKLTPPLGVLQGQGFRVALVTDGRMSGASGKVPAAIHVSPEALAGGPLGKRARRRRDPARRRRRHARSAGRRGRMGRARAGAADARRRPTANGHGLGRELFAGMRRNVATAEEGRLHMAVAERDDLLDPLDAR